jgi:putative ABC transport system permease protein
MFMWLTLSFRNILKNGRRSLMTILAIGLGFGAINLFQGYVHSTYQGLMDSAIHGAGLGHLTIYKQGYLDQGKLLPEKYQFSGDEVKRITEIVRQDPDVALVTPRLSVSGILSNGRNSTIFIAEGLVAGDDAVIRGDLTKFNSLTGAYVTDNERSGIVVGTDLARMLDLKEGSEAVALSNSYSGMANALDVKVRGIYNTGASATNDKMVLMTFPHAQDLVDFRGAERLVVLLKTEQNGAYATAAARALERKLAEVGFAVDIKTWAELSVFYNQVKNMFDMIFFFIFTIVLVIVVMSVINTMSMTVMERTREIGTLRALGFKQYGVKVLFSTEGMLLGFLGSMLGCAIFFAVYFAIAVTNPTYVPPASSNPVPLRVDLVWGALGRNLAFMLLLSMAAAFVPARRSARMQIVDALGHI